MTVNKEGQALDYVVKFISFGKVLKDFSFANNLLHYYCCKVNFSQSSIVAYLY